MKEEDQKKKLPIDAKLLSDAVIELNISRRSVGLYPPEHPITQRSIKGAYGLLKKLFELRSTITLGVAKDVLMVDEYTLDRKNPVFIEFSTALHEKGISAITFYSGLEEKEVLNLHTLITDKDLPTGQALIDLKECKELKHIRFSPLDVSKLRFVEGAQKESKVSGQAVWEDYVYGMMEGTLADGAAESVLFKIPPENVANILSSSSSGKTDTKEGYDRVITTYLSKKGSKGLKKDSLNRFMTLVENLSPGVKEQFLSRAVKHQALNEKETEELLEELTPEDVERMIQIFQKQSVLPESLRNFIDKFSGVKKRESVKEMLYKGSTHVDDIEINENMMKLFEEDQFGEFVGEQYQKDLEKMLKAETVDSPVLLQQVREAISTVALDSSFSDVILDLIDFKKIKREDLLKLLTRVTELTDIFLETGRFEEALHIYNTIYSQMITGHSKDEISGMMEYYFRSEQFTLKILEVFNIWGRDKRGAALKLARVLKINLITPLFDALNVEERSSQRKFYLSILSMLGRDVVQEAVSRLDDERWFVVRNMVYLIRECDGKEYIKKISALTKHKNKKVCSEALKTLVHLGAPDAFSHLRIFLKGNDPELKEQAIRLCGAYRLKEAVPLLIEVLKKPDILGSELHYKLLAVNALGKTGEPGAIDPLKKLFNARSFLYKEAFHEIRMEIIRSLVNYPFEKAGSILDIALVSRDEEARKLAQKLLAGDWNV